MAVGGVPPQVGAPGGLRYFLYRRDEWRPAASELGHPFFPRQRTSAVCVIRDARVERVAGHLYNPEDFFNQFGLGHLSRRFAAKGYVRRPTSDRVSAGSVSFNP